MTQDELDALPELVGAVITPMHPDDTLPFVDSRGEEWRIAHYEGRRVKVNRYGAYQFGVRLLDDGRRIPYLDSTVRVIEPHEKQSDSDIRQRQADEDAG